MVDRFDDRMPLLVDGVRVSRPRIAPVMEAPESASPPTCVARRIAAAAESQHRPESDRERDDRHMDPGKSRAAISAPGSGGFHR